MRAKLLGLLLILLSSSLQAQTLHICIGDVDNPPLSFPDHDGQAQYLIRRAALEQGWLVEFEAVPWRRCRAGVESGRYHGAGTATATVSNQQIMRFPLLANQLDSRRALGEFKLLAFRAVSTITSWDGQRFNDLHTPVLHNAGFVAVTDRLQQLGVKGDGSARTINQMMQMLLLGRGQIGIGQAPSVLLELQKPEFGGKLEALPTPVLQTGLYLGVNKAFYKQERNTLEAIWTAIGRIRTSPEWTELAPQLAH